MALHSRLQTEAEWIHDWGPLVYHTVCRYSFQRGPAHTAVCIRRPIATFLEKSFQRIYDLGVSCQADWKEIPLDYTAVSFSFSFSYLSLLLFVVFLHFHYL